MGRKGANQTALIFNVLGVLVCGLSTNMEMLIAARFVSTTTLILGSNTGSKSAFTHLLRLDRWLGLEGAVCSLLVST